MKSPGRKGVTYDILIIMKKTKTKTRSKTKTKTKTNTKYRKDYSYFIALSEFLNDFLSFIYIGIHASEL